ncbi:MAG: hypothetical protein E6Q27_08030 [Aeromicrobium sp.]|nr:MAG: hypothetical protein E6Q27_08030 [Aeromicrobium sp.]
MCSAAKCKTCGKTTWRGCGQHIDQVKRSVPAGQWCNGKHTKQQLEAAAAAKSGGGFWAKLTGR